MKKTFEDIKIDDCIYIFNSINDNYKIEEGIILNIYTEHIDTNEEDEFTSYNGLDYHYIEYSIGNDNTIHKICVEKNYNDHKSKSICRDGSYILFIYQNDAKRYIKNQINELIKRYNLDIKNLKDNINILKTKYKECLTI